MIVPLILALLSPLPADGPTAPPGRIEGVVVNGSRGNEPISGIEVVLRAGRDGPLEAVARTQTDFYGRFVFQDLPLEPPIEYLPGADRDGVLYPGARVRLDAEQHFAHVSIVTFEAVEQPSPLVCRRHQIEVEAQQDLLAIREMLLIANPSRETYVGKADGEERPVTVRLSVPPNFDRITFGEEFYGRRFRIVDHQPITEIPWPPGERELTFSYRIPLNKTGGVFLRQLDMRSADVTIRLRGASADHVSCNLDLKQENVGRLIFMSHGKELPPGHVVELRIGTPPFPWAQYTRWGSLIALAALASVTAIVLRRRGDVNFSAGLYG
jgi:hypothetical protein